MSLSLLLDELRSASPVLMHRRSWSPESPPPHSIQQTDQEEALGSLFPVCPPPNLVSTMFALKPTRDLRYPKTIDASYELRWCSPSYSMLLREFRNSPRLASLALRSQPMGSWMVPMQRVYNIAKDCQTRELEYQQAKWVCERHSRRHAIKRWDEETLSKEFKENLQTAKF